MTLRDRDWRVTVGTLRVSAPMRVSFQIERSLKSKPGSATVKLWNLTRDHQSQIEQAEFAQVVVEAGYKGDRGLETIFSGELYRARGNKRQGIRTERDQVDAVTHVEARDAGRAFQRARIEKSFGPGVRVQTVLRSLADALGVGVGNLSEVEGVAKMHGGDTFPEGTVLSGQASRELTRLLRGMGLRWSVQHGHLQVLRRGRPLQEKAVRLAADSGLVGRPEKGTRGRVTATALLTPDLWPGRTVVLDSRDVEGNYEIRQVTYSGDSHGNDWLAECELAPFGAAA